MQGQCPTAGSVLREPAMRFAGVPGSRVYRELESGETVYLRYVLRKPNPP